MKGNSCIGLLLLVLLASCGKPVTEILSAPKTKDQTGIIASCTSKADANALAQELGISYRVISEKRKLMEFIGITEKQLKEYLPKAKFKQNKIYDEVLISGNFKAQNIANYPYYGPHSRETRQESSARYFPHLKQIEAFDVSAQGKGVVIAIIDTGVYYNHPHLSPNIKVNEQDKHGADGDSSDNDGNGFRDDYVGWDFYNGDAYPIDDNGHGTHVAGLAASTYMGVAPKAKILPVKVLSADGRGDLGTIAAGILYAIDNGAHIINMSLGGSNGGQITRDVQQIINGVKLARQQGILMVAAAGNGGRDGIGDCNDNTPIYPANINEENMIAVASVDRYNNLADYSNFGGETVHVAAPGGDYFTGGLNSTAIPDCSGPCAQDNLPYVSMMGTSMATPVVSGLAAVLKSIREDKAPADIRSAIMNGCENNPDLEGLIKCGGVVNLQSAANLITE